MTDYEKLTRDTVKEGGILAMLYFDIHAATKEAVQDLGTGFINETIHKPGVVFALGEIEEPMDNGQGKNWSSAIEIKILVKDFATLAGLCMAHSPFSVEILRPDEIKLSLDDAHTVLGTISSASAEYKRYILTNLAKPEHMAGIHETLAKRAEMGKKLMERKSEKGEK